MSHKGLGAIACTFWGPNCHTIHTNHTPNCHTLHTSMTRFCHTLHTNMTEAQPQPWGAPRCQRAVAGPRTGRGPRQETLIPLPHEACFTEPEFDGIGRRTQRRVIRQKTVVPLVSGVNAACCWLSGREGWGTGTSLRRSANEHPHPAKGRRDGAPSPVS